MWLDDLKEALDYVPEPDTPLDKSRKDFFLIRMGVKTINESLLKIKENLKKEESDFLESYEEKNSLNQLSKEALMSIIKKCLRVLVKRKDVKSSSEILRKEILTEIAVMKKENNDNKTTQKSRSRR